MSYNIDGIEYPSVTTILGELAKPALVQWSANCAVDYMRDNLDAIQHPDGPHAAEHVLQNARYAYRDASDKAKDIGTLVHKAIEQYIKHHADVTATMPEQAQNGFLAFLDWEAKNHVQWLRSEVRTYHPVAGYAGTYDALADINGHLYIVDFKTSKGVYDEYKYQLAAYLAAEQHHIALDANLAVLRLDKETGEPDFTDVSKGWQDKYEAFCALTDWYYLSKRRRLKNNPRVTR